MNLRKFFTNTRNFIKHVLADGTEKSSHQIIPFGLLGVLTIVPFYFVNLTLAQGAYENLTLRIIGSALCLLLTLKNYWPDKFKKLLPFLWYLTLLYILPFFFLFMSLKNNMSTMWQINMVQLVLFLALLVDWISFILLVPLGFSFAYIGYAISTQQFHLTSQQQNGLVPFIFYTTIFALFSRNNQRIEQEKIQVMRSLSASIAHELRTPLRTINSSIEGVKHFLPQLLQSYELAKRNDLPVDYISPLQYESLLTACEHIESETESAFTVIGMLLTNVGQHQVGTGDFTAVSIEQCVDHALQRYPFDINEAQLVHWENEGDFQFWGNELLCIHVLFNLLKNALYYIRVARRGDIHIWLEKGDKFNVLHFKDTGKGISASVLPHIFDRFYSKTQHGSGIGLAFCKMVMTSFKGDIKCQSREDEFTEFLLYFPVIER